MPKQEPVLRLIIAYKLGRAGLALAAGLAMVVMLVGGFDQQVRVFAAELHDQVVSRLALWLSTLFMSALEPAHIVVVTFALLLDSVVLTVEGGALWTGYAWGAWLVVGASAALLPFEVAALVEHVSPGRVALLVLNLGIVGWLLQRRLRRPAAS